MAEKLHIGDTVDMIGARFEMVASMGAGEQDTVLFRTGMAPGRLVPLHSHTDPECFYILEGKIEVLVLDDAPGWRVAGAGQSVLVANGVKHAVHNTTETAPALVRQEGRTNERPVLANWMLDPVEIAKGLDHAIALARLQVAEGFRSSWRTAPPEQFPPCHL